jgi:hypothetical protein
MKRCDAAVVALLVLLCAANVRAQTTTPPATTTPSTTAQPSPSDTPPAPTKKAAKKPAKKKPNASQGGAASNQGNATPQADVGTKSSAKAPVAAASAPAAEKAAPAAPAVAAPSVEPTPARLAVEPASTPAPSEVPGTARLAMPVTVGAAQEAEPSESLIAAVPVSRTVVAAADPPPSPNSETVPAPAKDSTASAKDTPTSAKDKEELETLRHAYTNLVKTLVESGILTQEKAEALMRDAKQSAAQTMQAQQTNPQTKVVRVPYVPQYMRDEMKEELRQEVVAQAKEERWALPNAVPEWVDRFTFKGDLRLRYQANVLSENNAPAVDVNGTNAGNGLQLLNTTNNFDFFRYQLRLGADIKVSETVMAGVSLSSGNTGNPVSLNQTLGTGFNKNSVVIDEAYLRFDPARWLTIWGGRLPSPFYSTDLVWYDQLNFDGFAVTTRKDLGSQSRGWVTLGAFPVDTIDCTSAFVTTCGDNKWLYGAQGVFETILAQRHTLKVGLAYYDWHNYQGQFNSPTVNPADKTFVPRFAQKGNTYFNIVTNGGNPLLGLAPQYKELNLTGSIDMGFWDPYRTVLTGDIVKNIGYDQQQIFQQTDGLVDQSPRTLGWYVRLQVGTPAVARFGDWQAWGGYKYVQRDSVVDGYNDPDFHFGGTDAKGYLLGLSYGIARNTFARVRWYSANAIDGPPLAWDVLQIDVGAKF